MEACESIEKLALSPLISEVIIGERREKAVERTKKVKQLAACESVEN